MIGESKINVIYGRSDITPIVISAELSGHSEKPNRQLTLHLKNTLDGRKQAIVFEYGKSIIFKNNGTQLFIGVILNIHRCALIPADIP